MSARLAWLVAAVIVTADLALWRPTRLAQVLAADAEVKLLRVRLARLQREQAQPEPAPLWSKHCRRIGRQFVFVQDDGGPWKVSCTDFDLSRRMKDET